MTHGASVWLARVWLRVCGCIYTEFYGGGAFPPKTGQLISHSKRCWGSPKLGVHAGTGSTLWFALCSSGKREGSCIEAPGSPGLGASEARLQSARSCAPLFPAPIIHAARVPSRPRWQQRGVWETREGRGQECRGGPGIPALLRGWESRISIAPLSHSVLFF